MTSPDTTTRLWSEYLEETTLFDTAIRLQTIIRVIKRTVPSGARLLEVGFGSGTTAVLLADQGYQVTAIDLDPELVGRFDSQIGLGIADFFWRSVCTLGKMDMASSVKW